MTEPITQDLLTDAEGLPVNISNNQILEEATRLRISLNEVHWFNGRIRYHQAKVKNHVANVEMAAAQAEEAFGSLLKLISDAPPAEMESEAERHATALSRPPSTDSLYDDPAFNHLVGSVLLTPKGGNPLPLQDKEMPAVLDPVPPLSTHKAPTPFKLDSSCGILHDILLV
ncbi:hypothetical protein MPER_12931 [Moniliophthora perniciosa FA553]|nr:hypothetical protein MPER_12931 [Moniliophthora perniciosa FA553]